jgi:anaerobic selenocysteine-containing dehydrogenase
MTAGRPCDQSALTFDKLRGSGGIQWPVTDSAPMGTPRLYADFHFPTEPEYAESYGHDLMTGASNEADEYRAHDPGGRAILKAAHYSPPHEGLSDEYPLRLTTGRTVYHFHTRTKTGRAKQLQEAAPEVWAELSAGDAEKVGVGEGDVVRIESPRGAMTAPVRITEGRDGVVFVPFHYGWWDDPAGGPDSGRASAANLLTRTEWDPVSKQPIFKVAAVRVVKA